MPMTQEEATELANRFLTSSKQFLVAATRAERMEVVDVSFEHSTIPAIACYAFAIELGLKAIYITEKKRKIRGHELDCLFCKLSSRSKEVIESAVTIPAYPRYSTLRTFMDFLEDHSKAFENWRYACESENDLAADSTFLHALAKQVQRTASDLLS
ncbi:hypothetical protein [Chromobacterium amazonense]|uniref:hypothetical protein n=1 Tax=Chromobacterium amazonense TaxID=1382803 RepID=UPI003F79F1C0